MINKLSEITKQYILTKAWILIHHIPNSKLENWIAVTDVTVLPERVERSSNLDALSVNHSRDTLLALLDSCSSAFFWQPRRCKILTRIGWCNQKSQTFCPPSKPWIFYIFIFSISDIYIYIITHIYTIKVGCFPSTIDPSKPWPWYVCSMAPSSARV